MKRIAFYLAICAGMLSGLLAVAAPVQRPDRFPEVSLQPKAVPLYLALAADPWTNRVAYILFDGNFKVGYKRYYVWIPGDVKYGTPFVIQGQAAAPGKTPSAPGEKVTSVTFAPLKLTAEQGAAESSMAWTLTWMNRGGEHSWYNYANGKMDTYKVPDYSRVDFSLVYGYGPRGYSTLSAVVPLDMTINGSAPASESWTNMVTYLPWNQFSYTWVVPEMWPPWNSMHFYMTTKQINEKTKCRVRFDPKLGLDSCQHWMEPITVRTIPRDWSVLLVVSPYMGQPIYSNTVPASQCFKDGIEVDMPYGWYDLYWSMSCQGFAAPSLLDAQQYGVITSPMPFAKPDPIQ
jgi:hypothetical protein